MPIAVALTIGGSDSGGGAGIQADLKTFTALQVHGCSVLSCVTAQNTCGVLRVDALPPESLLAQLDAVLSDLPVAALKTGMLLNAGLVQASATVLRQLTLPRLIDPVMVSRRGAVLLEPEAIEAYRQQLLPLARVGKDMQGWAACKDTLPPCESWWFCRSQCRSSFQGGYDDQQKNYA